MRRVARCCARARVPSSLPHTCCQKACASPATALYAFCRLADDAVDLDTGQDRSRRAVLQRLKERLDRAYRGVPLPLTGRSRLRGDGRPIRHSARDPRRATRRPGMGCGRPALCQSRPRCTPTPPASPRTVGVMMALVMGVREPTALARACDLGAAMQLTNIARRHRRGCAGRAVCICRSTGSPRPASIPTPFWPILALPRRWVVW